MVNDSQQVDRKAINIQYCISVDLFLKYKLAIYRVYEAPIFIIQWIEIIIL